MTDQTTLVSNIVWKRPDGSVAITWCASDVDPVQERARLIERGAIPLDHEPVAINATIPARCEFRNAMVWDGKAVVHDMPRARDMRRNQLRVARAPVLDALDRDYAKAVGTKNTAAADAIEAKRQALRDATDQPAIDKAKTLDDLRAVKLPE